MKRNHDVPDYQTFSVCCAPHAEGTHPASEPCVERVSIETAGSQAVKDSLALMEALEEVRAKNTTTAWEALSVAAQRSAASARRYAQARLGARRA